MKAPERRLARIVFTEFMDECAVARLAAALDVFDAEPLPAAPHFFG